MVQVKEGQRVDAHGHKMFTVECHPEGQARAALIFHHGLGEHIGRYKSVFEKLADSGIAVYSGDALGHGKSEGERAYIENFDHLVDDFVAYCDYARGDAAQRAQPGPPPPMFIGGHSLGGLISAYACLRDQSQWAGLLVLSPALDVEMNLVLRMQAAVGGVLGAMFPRARVVKAVRPEDMNPDPECVKEYINDPLNTVGPLAARTANETLKAFHRLKPRYGEFTLPIYAHHGDIDKCTSMAATKRFIEAAASKDKTFHVLEGGYHEVLMSPGKEKVLSQMTDWILKHSAPSQKL